MKQMGLGVLSIEGKPMEREKKYLKNKKGMKEQSESTLA
jgi:hypothetical protein